MNWDRFFRVLWTILLMIIPLLLIGLVVCKEASSQEKFPEGYNPDGKIGNISLTVSGDYLSSNFIEHGEGFKLNGILVMPVTPSASIFISAGYQELRFDWSGQRESMRAIGVGFRLFGGIK